MSPLPLDVLAGCPSAVAGLELGEPTQRGLRSTTTHSRHCHLGILGLASPEWPSRASWKGVPVEMADDGAVAIGELSLRVGDAGARGDVTEPCGVQRRA